MAMKILMAESSRTIRKVVQLSLRKIEAEVAFAENRTDLIAMAKSLQPNIVLLSTTFPGLELSEDILTITRSGEIQPLPVLLLTDRGKGIDAENCKAIGASDFIFRPLDDRELQKKLNSLVTQQSESVDSMETSIQPTVHASEPEPETASSEKKPPTEPEVMPTRPQVSGTPEQRAQILMEIFESYLNENIVLLTDSLAKQLAPKIAPDVAGKIIESIDFSNLPFKIATIVEGVIQDLVPQLAEELITRELDKIKEEAARLLESEEQELQ